MALVLACQRGNSYDNVENGICYGNAVILKGHSHEEMKMFFGPIPQKLREF